MKEYAGVGDRVYSKVTYVNQPEVKTDTKNEGTEGNDGESQTDRVPVRSE